MVPPTPASGNRPFFSDSDSDFSKDHWSGLSNAPCVSFPPSTYLFMDTLLIPTSGLSFMNMTGLDLFKILTSITAGPCPEVCQRIIQHCCLSFFPWGTFLFPSRPFHIPLPASPHLTNTSVPCFSDNKQTYYFNHSRVKWCSSVDWNPMQWNRSMPYYNKIEDQGKMPLSCTVFSSSLPMVPGVDHTTLNFCLSTPSSFEIWVFVVVFWEIHINFFIYPLIYSHIFISTAVSPRSTPTSPSSHLSSAQKLHSF